MSRIPLPLKLLALVCALAVLPIVVSGALASNHEDDLAKAEAKLALCKRDLAQARGAVNETEDILALARRRPFVFVQGPGVAVPVPVATATNAVILAYLRGEIKRAKMVILLQSLVRRARQTVQLLKEAIEDARDGLQRTEKRCAALAEQRDKLKSGGGGGSGGGGSGGTGAFPGGTATKMTFTIAGASVTTDLKSNKQTGDPTIKGKSSGTLSGSVSLNGTLPSGWTVAVFHNGSADIVLNSPGGGNFTIKPISTGFDNFTRPSAYICSTKVPPLCSSPAAQANISVDWDP